MGDRLNARHGICYSPHCAEQAFTYEGGTQDDKSARSSE
jgi:hypothetical protein